MRARLVEHFERHVDRPQLLDPEWGAQLAKGTVGLRIPIAQFVCKLKLSQEDASSRQRRPPGELLWPLA